MYRGNTIMGDKWVYGFLFVAEDNKGNKQHQILRPDYFIGLHKLNVVKEESIEEYVKYCDVTGKKIYEGDRLEFEMSQTHKRIFGFGSREDTPSKYSGVACIHNGAACVMIDEPYNYMIEKLAQKKDKKLYMPLFKVCNVTITETHGEEPERKASL